MSYIVSTTWSTCDRPIAYCSLTNLSILVYSGNDSHSVTGVLPSTDHNTELSMTIKKTNKKQQQTVLLFSFTYGFSPVESAGSFPHRKPAMTESRYLILVPSVDGIYVDGSLYL